MATKVQIDPDAFLERDQPLVVQSADFLGNDRTRNYVGVWRAAPQGKSLLQQLAGLTEVASAPHRPTARTKVGKPPRVQLVGVNDDRIATPVVPNPLVANLAPKAVNKHLKALARRRRHPIGPQFLNQLIACNRLPSPAQKHSQKLPKHPPAQRDNRPIATNRQRTQDTEIDHHCNIEAKNLCDPSMASTSWSASSSWLSARVRDTIWLRPTPAHLDVRLFGAPGGESTSTSGRGVSVGGSHHWREVVVVIP
jgi:hypothetical protein